MTFQEKVMEDLKAAMRAKDTVTLTTLRALKTALTNAAIESGNKENVIEEAEALSLVRKQIKQRQDAIEQFEKADRQELADKEKEEIVVLERYLPTPLTEAEIEAIVDEAITETGATGMPDMGKVMKAAQEKAEGRADGKILSAKVRGKLA